MKSPITCITAAWMLIFFDEKSCEWRCACGPCKWCKWLTKPFRWWWWSCKSSLSLLVIGVCSELSRCTYIWIGHISREPPSMPLAFPQPPLLSQIASPFMQFIGDFSSQLFSSISTQSVLCKSLESLILTVDVVAFINRVVLAAADAVLADVWLVRRIISLPGEMVPLLNPYDRPIEFDRLRFGDRVELALSRRISLLHVRFGDLWFRPIGDAIEFHMFLALCFSIGSSSNGRYSNLVLLLLWYVGSCFGVCEWQLWRWCTFFRQQIPSPCKIKAILIEKIKTKKQFHQSKRSSLQCWIVVALTWCLSQFQWQKQSSLCLHRYQSLGTAFGLRQNKKGMLSATISRILT